MSTGGAGSAHNPTIVTTSKKLDPPEPEDQPTTDTKNSEE